MLVARGWREKSHNEAWAGQLPRPTERIQENSCPLGSNQPSCISRPAGVHSWLTVGPLELMGGDGAFNPYVTRRTANILPSLMAVQGPPLGSYKISTSVGTLDREARAWVAHGDTGHVGVPGQTALSIPKLGGVSVSTQLSAAGRG